MTVLGMNFQYCDFFKKLEFHGGYFGVAVVAANVTEVSA